VPPKVVAKAPETVTPPDTLVPYVEEPAPSPRRRVVLPRMLLHRKPAVVETEIVEVPEKPVEKIEAPKKVEPPKKVEAAPAMKVPVVAPEAPDWRKSWGKVEPRKLEEPKPEVLVTPQELSGPPPLAKLASEPP